MKYLLLTFWLVFGSFQTQSPLIPWSESTKLQWRNFRGNPKGDIGHGAMTVSFYVSTQQTYDQESYGSIELQSRWKKRIAAELAALDAYKGPEVKVLVTN